LADWVAPRVQARSMPVQAAALGRVLARDVVARLDLPPYDNAAMDGYALRHADLNSEGDTTLPVGGRTLAGDPPATLPPGQAWRIMTGAPMPAGADTVVMQEHVRRHADDAALQGASSQPDGGACPSETITLPAGQKPGQNVRRRGEDIRTGQTALPAGRILSPMDLGVAASQGIVDLPVFGPLKVGVFSTGNELVQGGQPLAAGQIHDSNRPTLLALARSRGFEAIDLGWLPDDPAILTKALASGIDQVDVLLTTGGAAGGDADLLWHVLSQPMNHQGMALPTEAHAWKLKLRPGRPLVIGRIGQTPVFGLPGNPVSAYVTFLLFVRPFVLRLQGIQAVEPQAVTLISGFDWTNPDRRREFLRAVHLPDGRLGLFRQQGSAVLTSAVVGHGLIDNPPGQTIRQGDAVRFLSFAELLN
ncbi:MAG: molybdopterin molybdotransferase MoeA, partial [Lautropia mirabilis]|nr:molybdopterin molybdotransferase MoeA [Lautropia mirabilis]